MENALVSIDPAANGKALLLTSGTEVSIAPKMRKKVNGSSAPVARSETQQKVDTKAKDAKDAEEREKRVRVLRVLPPRTKTSCQPSCPSLDDGSVAAVGYVSRTFLNELAGQPLYAKPQAWIASTQRLPPPTDPSQEPSSSNTPSMPAAVPRVLLPQDPDAPKTTAAPVAATSDTVPNQILVLWSPEIAVPDDHIALFGSLGGVVDWDYVK